MRIETGLVDQKGQDIYEFPGEKTNKPKKNRRRNKRSTPSVVQKLFDTCKEVFATGEAGVVPSPGDVERLRSVLDSMKPKDVGLTEGMPCFRTIDGEGTPPITYLHVYECDRFSIGIFCLPQSGVIPLHNHPGMTVFSKLLFGSMHIKSYDWVTNASNNTKENLNPLHYQPTGIRLAKMKNNSVFTPRCNTSILYPTAGGNMHCFTAVTPCAVLDVLGPPYSDPQGRHCTYYSDFPCASFSEPTGNALCLVTYSHGSLSGAEILYRQVDQRWSLYSTSNFRVNKLGQVAK
ncbi:plant cysteine oxidase 2-like isoform X2 [Macadamia integrifolia]|uniref:plant cysteine oxidase 2-like isoform X2 n=1 Tax=Macadamia integrifolia TaxID=60698 RepID=UPI001C52B811|nr:plant cysteine oxidase 2-like isoform X2 [Macadamia integrifolia]